MKVLHVITSITNGGAEILLANYLIEGINRKDFNEELCIFYATQCSLYDKLISSNIKIHCLSKDKKIGVSTLANFFKLIKKGNYSVIHAHLFPVQYICSLISILVRKPIYIFTEHCLTNNRRGKKIFRIFDYLSYKRYHRIVCVSDMVSQSLKQWIKSISKKIVIIPNGIPVKSCNKNEYLYDVLLVGALRDNGKGVDILLNAVAAIGDQIGKTAVAGDGKMMDYYVEMRAKLGLEKKVDFLGNRDDVEQLLSKSKVFVLPSRFEGMPVSILEAMAKSKAIIATKVGGIPQLIDHGVNGLLIQPENPDALARAILQVLHDHEFAKRIGSNAYSKVCKQFSIETYSKNLKDLYYSTKK